MQENQPLAKNMCFFGKYLCDSAKKWNINILYSFECSELEYNIDLAFPQNIISQTNCCVYLLYKGDIRLENYLFKIKKKIKHRKALTRLRLSCHPLMIEKDILNPCLNEPIENVHFVNL